MHKFIIINPIKCLATSQKQTAEVHLNQLHYIDIIKKIAQKLQRNKVNKYHMHFLCSNFFAGNKKQQTKSEEIVFGMAVTTY